MPGCKTVLDYEAPNDKANNAIDAAEWIFCLDFNTLSRTKRMEEKLATAKAERILIDHHEPQQKCLHMALVIQVKVLLPKWFMIL